MISRKLFFVFLFFIYFLSQEISAEARRGKNRISTHKELPDEQETKIDLQNYIGKNIPIKASENNVTKGSRRDPRRKMLKNLSQF
jgi:hypothetical protein